MIDRAATAIPNDDASASTGTAATWSVYPDPNGSGIMHVVPDFGREHLGHPGCWCNPHFDPVDEWILIHELDN